jgi:WD40 repeat protein
MSTPPAPGSSPSSRTLDHDNPWPGPEAFGETDHPFFFGRERAQHHLARLITQNRLVVLYGRSGLGKTSLLRAGVFPLLRDAHCLPVYIRLALTGARPIDVSSLRAQVGDAIEAVAEKWHMDAPPLDRGVTLWEWFFRSDVQFFNERSRRVRPVLVFDQFEEMFTHGRATEAQAKVTDHFLDEIIDLVRGSVPGSVAARLEQDASAALAFDTGRDPCGALIALRQEFLAELLRLRPRLPSVLDHRFELSAMTIEDAERVVTGPGGHLIEESVAGQIVRFVAGARRGTEDSAPEATMVDPAILSIFCSELNAKRQTKAMPRITPELVTGAQDTIIADFYDRRVEDLHPEVQRFIESRLVTESGFRNSEALEEALRWPMVTAEVVDQLIERRLLVREGGGPRARLELTHDVLLEPIIQSRTLRQLREREEQARIAEAKAVQDRKDFEERSRRERELETARVMLEREREMTRLTADLASQKASEARKERDARKRQRWLIVSLAVALIIASALAWRSYVNKQDAIAATRKAEANQASSHLEQGLAAISGGNRDRGLAYIARALRVDATNTAARSLALDAIVHGNWPLPVAQARHDGAFWSIRFDATGSKLVTASDDRTVRVWNAADLTAIGSPLEHEADVYQAQFTAAGGGVLTLTAEGVAHLWEVGRGRELRRFTHQPAGSQPGGPIVISAIANPVDDRIATGDDKGTVRLWSGENARSIRVHRGPVTVIAFDPAGRRLLTGSADGSAAVWDATTGSRLAVLTNHTNEVVAARFTPDGQMLATASRDATVNLYWAATYKPAGTLRHEKAVELAAFDPTGATLATVSGNSTMLWDTRSAQLISDSIRHDGPITSLQFSPEGQRVLTASKDGTARIWDSNGSPITEAIRVDALAAAFRPDGMQVVIGAQDGSLTAWDVRTGSAISSVWRPGCDDPSTVGFSADSQELISACGTDGAIVFWNHDGGVVRRLTDPAWAGMSSVSLSDDARLLVVVAQNKAFIVRTSGEAVTTLEHGAPVSSAVFSADGQSVLTVVPDGPVRIWNALSGQPLANVGEPGGSVAAAFSADGSSVVALDSNAALRVWTVRGSPVGPSLKVGVPGLPNTGRSVSLSRDGQHVLTQEGYEPVTIYEAKTGARIAHLPPGGRQIAFAGFAKSGVVLTAGASQQIWEGPSWQLLATFAGSVDAPVVARFSEDGRRVGMLSSKDSVDYQLGFWDVRTGQPHARPWRLRVGYGAGFILSPDGQSAAMTAVDRRLALWDAPTGTPQDAERIAEMVEAAVGFRVNEQLAVERIGDRRESLRILRGRCDSGTPLIRRLCQWMLADAASRTINPFTSVTVDQFVRERLKSPFESDRVEARALLPWDARLRSGAAGSAAPNAR